MENKLLVVDDEKELSLTLSDIYLRQGYKVETAFSGEEALRVIQSAPFDVILLDIEMPGLSGFDVLKSVKGTHPSTKVIIMTGHKEYEKQSRLLHCDEFLRKPFSLDSLTSLLSHLLQKKYSEEKTAVSLGHKFTEASQGSPMANILLIEPIEQVAHVLMEFLQDEQRAKGYYKIHHVPNSAQAVIYQKLMGPSLVMIDLKTVFSSKAVVRELVGLSTPPKDFIFYFDPTIPNQDPLPGKLWEGHPMREEDLKDLAVLLSATALEHGLIKRKTG